MKKILKLILLAVLTAALLVPFAACGDTTTTEPEPPVTGDEPFGITQRPNDLTEYEDLRPDRQPYVDNAQPDTGTLVDHIYEFEEMNISGTSNDKDHLCPNKSFVLSRDFSGYIALENIASGVFTLTLESDKEVRVPLLIGLSCNYVRNQPLSNALTITNNGHSVADTSVIVPESGKNAQGAPGGYFDMVEVESEISLVKGTNRIVFRSVQAGPNYDYVNIRTSANLVNNTPAPAWADPTFTVKAAPSEISTGLLTIGCGEDCTDSSDDQLPTLDFEGYAAEKEGDVTTYTFDLMGQSFEVAKIDESVEKYPEDTGEKKDNYFEFERAAITGHSQNIADHFCASDSLVFSHSFGGNFCVENMSSNTFTFTVESDKKICAEFDLGLSINYVAGEPMNEAISITVNGKTGMADLRALVPTSGTTAEVGDISGYFAMAEVSGTINLDEGENIIAITRLDANLDYINIRTSATLTDKTVPYFSGSNIPAFEVVKAPTTDAMGELTLNCSHGGCTKGSRSYAWLPVLGSACYDAVQNGEYIDYSLDLLGQTVKIGSAAGILPEEVPEDDGELVDHIFEFENAAITGHSQNVADHFCAADSVVVSYSFSGNVCLEATGSETKYTFTIESDRALVVPFEIGMGQTGTAGAELSTVLSMTNNGRSDLVDLTDPLPSQSEQADMGGISVYFHMVKATGKIQLAEGENVIEITKNGGNVDYFNIMTSATLTDKTVPYWSGDHMLAFEVTTAPTETTRGELKVTCPNEGCTKGERLYDYGSLPELTNDCYTVEDDGYYIELFSQSLKVADLTAEAA